MASVNSTSTTNAYSYLQYKNKIGGLVSGMDIDSIMEKLMKAESAQMEKLQQQKQKYEWKRDAYREVNTKLNSFYTDAFDQFGLQSKWSSKTASVSNNSGAATIEAKSNASGNLSIQSITPATAASSSYGAASGMSAQRVTGSSTLDAAGLGSTLSIFGKDASTFDEVMTELNANGYTASIANGQLKISAGTSASTLDANTTESLSKLGFNFNQVSSKLTYKDSNNVEQTATGSTKLADAGLSNGEIKITVDGKEHTFDLSSFDETDTVGTLLTKIKEDTGLTVTLAKGNITFASTDNETIQVDTTNNTVSFENKLKNSVGNTFLEDTQGTNTSTITGKNTIQEVLGLNTEDGSFALRSVNEDGSTKTTTISYKSTDTIDSFISKINSSGAGVTALFNNGKLSITASNTGTRNDGGAGVSLVGSFEVQDADGIYIDSSDAIKLFDKLSGGANTELSTEQAEYTLASGGSLAKMNVNGIDYEQNSNVFTISGYTITANEAFSSSTKPITITSSNDTDQAVDKVKSFVDMYNSLIKELNTKTGEKRNVSYDPLTDAQKAEMTTDEITKWEEKAKAGLLKGDTNITNMLSKMRSILNGGSGGDTLYNIGVTTSKTWSDNGKLEIDETKLRQAIEKDPDVLSRIFVGSTDSPGMISQLRTEAKATITNIEKSAGKDSLAANQYSLGKTITSLDTKISDWKDRLKSIEERYWKQFSAMETAIQKANNQSSIFSQ